MTTQEKQQELIKRFGQKFYNELGDRVTHAQKMQGGKGRVLDTNALHLANLATEEIYRDWITLKSN